MPDSSKDKPIDPLLEQSELIGLVELQKFLADEVGTPGGQRDFSRAFTPLTQGLGLESPKTKPAVPVSQVAPEIKAKPEPIVRKSSPEVRAFFETDPVEGRKEPVISHTTIEQKAEELVASPAAFEKSLEAIIDDTPPPLPKIAQLEASDESPNQKEITEGYPSVMPPALPTPSFGKRFFAAFIDEIFVLTLVATAAFITSYTIGTTSGGFPEKLIRDFMEPAFQRFFILEFTTIWLAYFAFGIGVLDMTFGMWAWGLRVSYSGDSGSGRALRKLMRILLSFVFFAPLAPIIFLSVRFKKRNLIDLMSGTSVYQSAV